MSEYLVRELSEQADLSHADGRARFSELARPLFAKLSEGVYRELLLTRIAGVVGIAPQRLNELWSTTGAPQSRTAAEAPPPAPTMRTATQGRTRTSAGRGSLVRQAIDRLVRFPAIAAEVSAEERAGLEVCEEAGIELLRELLDDLRERPVQIPAQVIQRWADKPGGDALQKLLQREEIVADAAAAAGELRGALVRLADIAAARRLEALEEKSRTIRLEPEELKEFQRLMMRRKPRDGGGS